MKKTLLIILFIATVTLSVKASQDSIFFDTLVKCGSYHDKGIVNTQGVSAEYTRQIRGWENNKCVYQEFVKFSGIDSCTTCKFSQNQLNEFVSVMKAYETLLKYSDEKPNLSSIESASNNPIAKTWNKYLQDPNICTIKINNGLNK